MKIEHKLTTAIVLAIVTNLAWCGVAWYLLRQKEQIKADLEGQIAEAHVQFKKERDTLVAEQETAKREFVKQIEDLDSRLSRMAEYPSTMIKEITGIRDQLKKGADVDSFTLESLKLVAGRLRSIEESYSGPLRELEQLKDGYRKKLGKKPEAPKGWIIASIFRRGAINAYNRDMGRYQAVGQTITDLGAAYSRAQKSVNAQSTGLKEASKQLQELTQLNQESYNKAIEFCDVANRMLDAHRRFVESDAYKKARDLPSQPLP